MKTIEQLEEELENARGGQNTGDIEAAAAALEEAKYYELREAAKFVVATAFGNTDGLSLQTQLESLRLAVEQLKVALGMRTQCYLCDGLGGYAITGSTGPGQVCPVCSGTGFQD